MIPKHQAIKDLERARSLLGSNWQLARMEYNPKAVLIRSVKRHPWPWVGGAVLGGLFLARGLMPKKTAHVESHDDTAETVKKGGMLALVLSPLIFMARQAALKYGRQYLQDYLIERYSRNQADRARARSESSPSAWSEGPPA